jgi:hypothetical protein
MADERGRRRRERPARRDLGRDLELMGARHRADGESVARLAHVRELRHAVQVDEERRLREPEGEERHEALPAGEDLRLVAAVRERRESLVDGTRRDVVELRRLHCAAPCVAAAAVRTALMMFT